MGRGRVAVVGALIAALAAGCSGGGDKQRAAPADLTPVTSTTEPSFTGAGSGPFCAEIKDLDRRFSELLTSSEPDATRTLFTSAQKVVASLADGAPAEIRGDLAVIVGAYRQLLDGLRKVDFDVARLSPEVVRGLDAADVRTAGDRLGVYTRKVCNAGG